MIQVTGLSKRYARHVAVNNISFSVEKGDIVGFLGPNGAGKTTTMRMLTCFMPPTDGQGRKKMPARSSRYTTAGGPCSTSATRMSSSALSPVHARR